MAAAMIVMLPFLFAQNAEPRHLIENARLFQILSARIDSLTNWRVQKLDYGLIVESVQNGEFCSGISPAQYSIPGRDCIAQPLKLYLVLLPKETQREIAFKNEENSTLQRELMATSILSHKKTYFLDSPNPEIIERLKQNYHFIPTHHFSRKFDLLVVAARPSYWLEASFSNSLTKEYYWILKVINAQFRSITKNGSPLYLGTMESELLRLVNK
jgi:hypothetical protein